MSRKFLVKNNNGVSIAMCCASCKNKALVKDARLCLLDKKKVTSDYLCPDWELCPALEKAGTGGGKVKKRRYLEFALTNMSMKKEDMRDRFMEEHGDIYEE